MYSLASDLLVLIHRISILQGTNNFVVFLADQYKEERKIMTYSFLTPSTTPYTFVSLASISKLANKEPKLHHVIQNM